MRPCKHIRLGKGWSCAIGKARPEGLPAACATCDAREPAAAGDGLLRRAASYAKAELSLFVLGPVADEEFERRKRACKSCRGLVRHPIDQIGFCGLCGCGRRKRASLSVKLRMPEAKCPLRKW